MIEDPRSEGALCSKTSLINNKEPSMTPTTILLIKWTSKLTYKIPSNPAYFLKKVTCDYISFYIIIHHTSLYIIEQILCLQW